MALETIRALLTEHGQEHLLPFAEQMTDAEREAFLKQLEAIDFGLFDATETVEMRGKIAPIDAFTIEKRAAVCEENRALGREMLRSGKVAALMLAGGQGTRLGSASPKGCYNVGLTRDYFLFQAHVEKLVELEREIGVKLPLYIMTSDKNHEETVAFFQKHGFFGYGEENIGFFRQKSAPCTDFDKRLLMEDRAKIATSPNGNGGWYVSLLESECGKKMRERGIEWITLFGVDNPLQRFCDAEFIGASVRNAADCTVKVVRKAYPEEQMGVMCLEDGKPSMIAYAEMSDELRFATDDRGELLYTYGDILNMMFPVEALDRCMTEALPVHIARKKIPFVDADGTHHAPDAPNGFKYEMFLFDAMKYMNSVFLYEVKRENEFAPIKNLVGKDSVESARIMLKENGVEL